MHYHVIQKSYQNRGRWLTFWQVEVIEGDRKAVYCFGGRLCLQRFLVGLDQKIADAAAQRAARAKANAATLIKRHYRTWWGASIDRKTGRVEVPKREYC